MTRCESFDFYSSLQRHNDTTTTSSHTLGHTHTHMDGCLCFLMSKEKIIFLPFVCVVGVEFLTVSCFSFFKLTSHGTMELQVFLVVWLYYGSHHIHLFWPQNTIETIIHIICLWCWNLFQWPEEKRSNLPTYLPIIWPPLQVNLILIQNGWMDGRQMKHFKTF